MTTLLEDMMHCDTHGFDWLPEPEAPLREMIVNLPNVEIRIEKRNFYCNRGRYGFWAMVKDGREHKLDIDFADAFPRYFFSLQRALDEMNDWVQMRKTEIYADRPINNPQDQNTETPLPGHPEV